MTGQGFDEAVTYCFISRKESDAFAQDRSLVLELSNPISEDLRYLRTTLVPSLCKVAATNLNYGQQGVRIFETGAAYYSSGKEHPIQRPFLAFAVCGTRESRSPFEKNRPYDFFDLKGACETLADSLDISLEYRASSGRPYLKKEALDVLLKGEEIGILGGVQSGLLGQLYGIDKEVFYGEILIDNLPVINAFNKKYKALSRFPSVINDISFTLDKAILHKEVEETILSLNIKELENVYIYDIFEGKNIPEGKKSVTYTLRFRSENRTLTSEEVREKVDKVMDALQKRFRAELRTQKQGCLT
jgi:phenylalanyl-tRNA synthetase beta chain